MRMTISHHCLFELSLIKLLQNQQGFNFLPNSVVFLYKGTTDNRPTEWQLPSCFGKFHRNASSDPCHGKCITQFI